MAKDQLTVIVPALNEAAFIGRTLEHVRQALPGACVIVVDGGSTYDTRTIASRHGATVIECSPGRGVQCHAGALRAASEWLLFLHADTLVPTEAGCVIVTFASNPRHQIATFRARFYDSALLTAWARFTRFESVFTRFADQGILIRRTFYEQLGGFPPWPLFEEVALFQRARRLTRIHWLPATVTTSARRFRVHGIARQRVLNALLILRYLAGASPFDLAKKYHAHDSTATVGTPAPRETTSVAAQRVRTVTKQIEHAGAD